MTLSRGSNFLPAVLAAAIAMVPITGRAGAPPHVVAHDGAWSVLRTPADDAGKPLCVLADIGRNWYFAYKYQAGSNHLDGEMWRQSWAFPPGTPVAMTIDIDGAASWTVQAIGRGDRIGWILPQAQVARFEKVFRAGRRLTVSFVGGAKSPWSISLVGSNDTALAMGHCMHQINAAGQGPTQPFSGPPAPRAMPPARPTPAPPHRPAPPANPPAGAGGIQV